MWGFNQHEIKEKFALLHGKEIDETELPSNTMLCILIQAAHSKEH
jgi:hypothetical protein